MITEDHVSFETAKLLKEKGFDCACKAWYAEYTSVWGGDPSGDRKYINIQFDDKNMSDDSYKFLCYAPTLQMAMKWLREVHNIHIAVNLTNSEEPKLFPPEYYVYIDNTLTGEPLIREVCSLVQDETLTPKGFKHSEEACEAAIKYCLENLI